MKRLCFFSAGAGMLFIILDSRCAVQSAAESLELCLKTVIPSLFPMFVLSGILVSGCRGASGRIMAPLETITGLPTGGGMLFLLGILGGFPVGAQSIAQAVENRILSKSQGERMLGFCNNCSPAFLFGIAGGIFSGRSTVLWIFLIQLESALLLASLTDFQSVPPSQSTVPSGPPTDAVTRAVRSVTSVCAWVILAGVAVGFLRRWLYPLLPGMIPAIVTGLLEITGGVLGLTAIDKESVRFILCSGYVCFGGFCVWMQISALASAKSMSTAACFRQKTAQGVLGTLLAMGVQACGPVFLLIVPAILIIRKITLENPDHSVYNGSRKGGLHHVVP